MIDHISVGVSDVETAKKFYAQALEPLGYSVAFEGDWGAGYSNPDGQPDFWIGPIETPARVHVAFYAENRSLVDAFHAAALAAGGKDNGAPGLRPHYHPNYYGAFALDPDGHNIEAVCHKP
jgi:catechol 2,3-dioxygenase-like lactoylglutathione lyase family enzyme